VDSLADASDRDVLAEVERRGDAMVRRAEYRDSLHAFVRDAWPHVCPQAPFVDGRHLHVLCEVLEEHAGATGDLVVNVPPGSGKSLVCSVLWPAWIWATRDPSHRVIATSYADKIVQRDGRAARELLASEWWSALWPHISVPWQNTHAASDWTTSLGGVRISVPAGGQVTGRHCNTFIVDDPIKPADARLGRAELARIQTWWDETVPPRVLPGGRRLIVMQRLHALDLSGTSIERGAAHLVLPMRFESARADPRDWRREDGALLWPEAMSAEVVDARESAMSPYAVAGQEQQRPAPEGGGIFRAEWLEHRWTKLPDKGGVWLQSWDLAFKGEASSDDVAGGVWCAHDGFYDLVHQVRGKLSFVESVQAICQLADDWPKASTVLVEDKANGPAVIETLRRLRPSLEIIPVEPQGGKEARAHATTRLWHGGRVRLPALQPWVDGYVGEHLVFPAGAQDGQVDQSSQALTYLSSEDEADYAAGVRAHAKALGIGR
jgi:predicted phage terminase large subunit-like protein